MRHVYGMIAVLAAAYAAMATESVPATTQGAATQPSAHTLLRLMAGDAPVEGYVGISTPAGVRTEYVTKKGKNLDVGPAGITVRYYARISQSGPPPMLAGSCDIRPEGVQAETVLRLEKTEAKLITVQVQKKDGKPWPQTRVDVIYLWNGVVLETDGTSPSEDGDIKVYLAANDTYRLRASWPDTSVKSDSPPFVPSQLKTSEFRFVPSSPEEQCFGIKFMILEGGRKRPAIEVPGCELTGKKRGGISSGSNGQFLVRFFEKGSEYFGVGDEVIIRLPTEVEYAYKMSPSTIRIGEPGTSCEIILTPREHSKIGWAITHDGKPLSEPDTVDIAYKGPADVSWTGTTGDQELRWEPGELDIRAFAYGYRVYRATVKIVAGDNRVPIELATADKAVISVGPEGKSTEAEVRILYLGKDGGALGSRVYLKDGKGEVYYDGDQQAGLMVKTWDYAPVLVRLDKKQQEYKIAVIKGARVKVAVEKNAVVKDLADVLLKETRFISVVPFRQMLPKPPDGIHIIAPGTYIPVVDLATGAAPYDLVGKAVECEPVKISADTTLIKAIPIRIVPMQNVLVAE